MPGNNRKRPSSAASTSAKRRCVSEAESTCKLDAFAIGGIIALHQEGYSRQDILESMSVDKPDGSALADGNIGQVIRRWEADKSWRGERAKGSVAPRATTAAEDKAIVKTVLDRSGKEKITSGKAVSLSPAT